MKKMNFVVVSKEEGLYDTVTRHINEKSPNASVTRADSVSEGVEILEKRGSGVILTDLSDFDLVFPETYSGQLSEDEIPPEIRPFPVRRTETIRFTPDRPIGNTKADIEAVKRFVRMHLDEDLSLARLSVLACLTPNYLSSLFRKKEGVSLKSYIERNRMDRAAYLLVNENTSIYEIASKVGYRYCSYFCSVFRQHYGITPRQYRKRQMEKRPKKQAGVYHVP